MKQTNPKREALREPKTEMSAELKTDAVKRLLQKVADDARDEADHYIEETKVPAGGE